MTLTLALSPGFTVLDRNESVVDRVERHLRFFFREDFFRPLAGVPYGEVLERRGLDRLTDVVRREALKVRDVTAATVRVIRIDSGVRVARIEVVVESEFGRSSVAIEI